MTDERLAEIRNIVGENGILVYEDARELLEYVDRLRLALLVADDTILALSEDAILTPDGMDRLLADVLALCPTKET